MNPFKAPKPAVASGSKANWLSCLLLLLGAAIINAQSVSSNGVAVVLRQVSSNYVVGQPIPLALVFSNLTDRGLMLRLLRTGDRHAPRFPIGEVEVTTSEGKPADRVQGGDPVVASILAMHESGAFKSVPPRGVLTWTIDLTNSFVLTNEDVYAAKATVHVPRPDAPTSGLALTTAPITFAVKAPATNGHPAKGSP